MSLLTCALLLAACGSDDATPPGNAPDPTPPGAVPPSTPPPSPSGVTPPSSAHGFPLSVPALDGYTLVDAFPNVVLHLPSALVWPTVGGAGPFALERSGRVVQIEGGNAREVLDFEPSVAMISEAGALGMALHPRFGDGTGPMPYVYIWYNANGMVQRLSRFTWSASSGTFDRASELVLLEEAEVNYEHNAGRVAFGPDGFLYFGNGDDLNTENHQRLDRALFAGLFRIDVDSRGGTTSHAPLRQPEGGLSTGYFIPNDNPFVGRADTLEEFFALGFRNPFGFSFDRETGALWVGDVGDTWREEVDEVVSGGNYGWPYREGDIVRSPLVPVIGTLHDPKYVYTHAEMGDLTAILGGFVYRGKEMPELVGKYIYSDWPSCRLWALDQSTGAAKRTTLVDNQWDHVPMALAEDNAGEIYLLHATGAAKLVRDAVREQLPKRLSDTTLFNDLATLDPASTLVPYDVASPLWSDGAVKGRWIDLPAGARVEITEDGTLTFPIGTLFVKNFELPPSVTPRGRTRRLETRVMIVGIATTYGLTYKWNADGTDAELSYTGSDEEIVDDAAGQTRSWHIPSFGQCWSCHRTENRILGFTGRQLTADGPDQISRLVDQGVFEQGSSAKLLPRLVRPMDTTASLSDRASSYLAANCSSCHHAGASYLGGEDTWNASPGVALADRGLLGAPHHNPPMAERLGLSNAPLIEPGNPDGSILMARIKSTDPDLRMPPLGRTMVDAEGAKLIEDWIRSGTGY
ncbi:hypothetical protein AKJ09_05956 [Labilithrix luteola]|uniref:Glucose/Sorbosone dehydrogenase domain-containing protein n=1 Tax=Labilithrix luteola TaxID=1391654 RepID=A0A0K1Q0N5_9BACT|nr:PQQ-dependent sugar dehydrogenase [Labilithrix luteola]AKU99292.1 hypothetical protein AKJ09_05956 [Labilithrix luteola]